MIKIYQFLQNINFNFIENIGTSTVPNFAAPQYAPFSIPNTFGDIKAAFGDIDNDGDLDIVAEIGIYGDVYYFENTGSSTAPSFTTPVTNPFGLGTKNERRDPSLGDLDNDGDLDLIFGNRYTSGFTYYENIGTASAPSFGSPQDNPFYLRELAYDGNNQFDITPNFVDLNNDGLLDIMAGAQYRGIVFFENVSPSTAGISMNTKEIISIYPNPATSTIKIESADKIELIAIYDLQGSLVDTTESDLYSVNHLETGVYIVIVKTENGIAQSKFVKQ